MLLQLVGHVDGGNGEGDEDNRRDSAHRVNAQWTTRQQATKALVMWVIYPATAVGFEEVLRPEIHGLTRAGNEAQDDGDKEESSRPAERPPILAH